MRTADLPIGAHVALDTYNGRSYHNFVEAYVIAHRPRGNKSSYWGNNGNTRTIGVMYKQYNNATYISFDWVMPSQIHMLWSEWTEIEDAAAARKAEHDAKERKARANRRKRMSALPADMLKVLEMHVDGYKYNDILKYGTANVYITVDKLEAIVKAVLADARPESVKIQDEIDAALRLLV